MEEGEREVVNALGKEIVREERERVRERERWRAGAGANPKP
jgi:hypothetical protein